MARYGESRSTAAGSASSTNAGSNGSAAPVGDGRVSASDAPVTAPPMPTRLLSLVLRPTAGSLAVGIVVAASLLGAETLLVYLLKQIAPMSPFGVIYLLGVLVVSTGWGFGLSMLMSLASALAFDFYRMRPESIIPTRAQDWVAIGVFLAVALSANTLAGLARSRAVEAHQRRRETESLADQQAALRRVATLVARGLPPPDVFSAVAAELARCLRVDHSALVCYQPDGAALLLAAHDVPGGAEKMRVGERFSVEGQTVASLVWRTGRAARTDSHDNASGSAAARIRELGLRSGVGAPIVVDGRLWGAAVVGWSRSEPLPPGTEARLGDFADLVATAIANTATRAELIASRARIVAAADDARRRLERDLHDGAQQQLVALGLVLRTAEASLPPEPHPAKEQISHVLAGLAGISEELREISRGIHPAILSKGGLGPALKTLARRSAVPVELDVSVHRRWGEPAEVAAYYIVAEALTNATKHAQASQVNVRVEAAGPNLRLSIRDDGIGGVDPTKGSGIIGLRDRVEALGGEMVISSPPASGTSLMVEIPCDAE
jgi:signal transduction histidine kinase